MKAEIGVVVESEGKELGYGLCSRKLLLVKSNFIFPEILSPLFICITAAVNVVSCVSPGNKQLSCSL